MNKDIIKIPRYLNEKQDRNSEKLFANRLADQASQRLNRLIKERMPNNHLEFQIKFVGVQEGSDVNSPDSYTFNVGLVKDRQGRLRSEEEIEINQLIIKIRNHQLSAKKQEDFLRTLSDSIFLKDITFYINDLDERVLWQKTLDKLEEFELIDSTERKSLEINSNTSTKLFKDWKNL